MQAQIARRSAIDRGMRIGAMRKVAFVMLKGSRGSILCAA